MSRAFVSVALLGALCLAFLFAPGASVTAAQPPPPLFLRDVAPILDKKGCSTAACHGKFGGRGGFQVSLLTLSPQDDYDPIVRAAKGRRVNLVEPEKSLLLLKATGKVAHGGGERFAAGSPEYNILRDWITAGAPFDPATDPKLASLSVSPGQTVLPKVGAKLALKVVARFSDGSARDVTRYANYESSDVAVAGVDQSGVVTGKRWGGMAVIVRYLGTVRAAFLTLPRADKTPYPKLAGNNFVDDLVLANLKRMNVVPSRLTTDREFIRRVTLDVCGRLPDPAEVEAFAADKTGDKRARLIDTLLDSPDYADLRTVRLGDLLRIHPRNLGNNNGGERGAALWTDWVRDAVAANMPYDKFVRQIILARGSTYQQGPTNFYRVDRKPEDRMETVGQAFMGLRMSCARCHKNPFDRWTTDDYWNFAAFLGKVGSRGGKLDNEIEIFYNAGGRVINQSVTGRKGQDAVPTLLGDTKPFPITDPKKQDVLEQFADWVTGPQNPYFARATVNRLWGNYLGRGVIHPVDDMRATTPASVPGLIEALAGDFTKRGFDVKRTIRVILNSRTYQTASDVNPTNKLDDKFFSHFYPRPLIGQVLLDALNQATGTTERFGDFPVATKAAQLSLPVGSYFLDTFGRSHREFLAELEPKVEPTLVQTLHILNSPYIDNKVKAQNGTLAALLKDKTLSDEALVKALYAKTFCRPPTPKEMAKALAYLKASVKRDEGVQDLMWALISAREFYFVS